MSQNQATSHASSNVPSQPVSATGDTCPLGEGNANKAQVVEPNNQVKTIASEVISSKRKKRTKADSNVWKFDPELCRKELARMIIIDELPFRFIEREGFRRFMSVVQPKLNLYSRTTLTKDCFEIFLLEKKILKEIFVSSAQRVSLTTDCWTSIQNLYYMSLTAHYIDKDWNLQKKIINFCLVPSHKGEVLAQHIEKCLLGWGIENLCTITVDNASSNDSAIKSLKKKFAKKNALLLNGDYLHMRCAAHILNLIVKDGLEEVNPSISRIRNAVKYVRSSPSRFQDFKRHCEHEKITFKKLLCLDVCTRWNSTYLMLQSALEYKLGFEHLEDEDSTFAREMMNGDGLISYEDWVNCQVLCKFLEKFHIVTKQFSTSHYVTSNIYFHETYALELLLIQWSRSNDVFLRNMSIRMLEKFHKYWGQAEKFNLLLLVAVVLDPRYKLRYVDFCYGKIYPKSKVEELLGNVRNVLESLLLHYQLLETSNVEKENGMHVAQKDEDLYTFGAHSELKFLQDEFEKYLEEEEIVENKSELDRYLSEGIDKNEKKDSNFNILQWWKVNGVRFPLLGHVARDILAIPLSTVASESAFSTSGRVLDQFRSSLTPSLVEALICCQDWLSGSNEVNVEENMEELLEFG